MGLKTKGIGGAGGGPAQKEYAEGTYPARVVQIIDRGVQPQRPFQGKDKPPMNEVEFTYELVDEFMKDDDGNDMEDKPRWIREKFPIHDFEKDRATSTKRRIALDPEDVFDGDLAKLINMPCLVVVVQNSKGDKVYNNVGGVNAMRPKDVENCVELVNPTKVFLMDEPDLDVFNSLPSFQQDDIKDSLEYKGSKLEALIEGKEYVEDVKEEEEW